MKAEIIDTLTTAFGVIMVFIVPVFFMGVVVFLLKKLL